MQSLKDVPRWTRAAAPCWNQWRIRGWVTRSAHRSSSRLPVDKTHSYCKAEPGLGAPSVGFGTNSDTLGTQPLGPFKALCTWVLADLCYKIMVLAALAPSSVVPTSSCRRVVRMSTQQPVSRRSVIGVGDSCGFVLPKHWFCVEACWPAWLQTQTSVHVCSWISLYRRSSLSALLGLAALPLLLSPGAAEAKDARAAAKA